MLEIIKQIHKALLQSTDAIVLLDHIYQLYGSRSHLWSVAAAEMGSGFASETDDSPFSRTCDFSGLVFEPTQIQNEVTLSGLARLSENSEFPTACVASLLAVLARQQQVVDIRLRHEKTLFNNYIKSIVQSEVYAQGEEMYPYMKAGLNGTGQVIGIGDSGLDELSCFFNEGDDSLMIRSNYTDPVTDVSRRKVIQYVDYKGGDDTPGGHGTQ